MLPDMAYHAKPSGEKNLLVLYGFNVQKESHFLRGFLHFYSLSAHT